MTSPNRFLQPSHEGHLPLSLWIALLAIFSAVGIILRQIAIPTYSIYVTLTPGFIIPLLAGIVLGPLGGILCGVLVGISGALWEPILIPLVGNIALGLSTGIPTYFQKNLQHKWWMVVCFVSAVIFGGFLPTFAVEVFLFIVPPYFAALTASIDAIQAGIWVLVAILLTQGVIDTILVRYRRTRETE